MDKECCSICGAEKVEMFTSLKCPNGCFSGSSLKDPTAAQGGIFADQRAFPPPHLGGLAMSDIVNKMSPPVRLPDEKTIKEGTTTFQLSDGTVIKLYDWSAGSLYSSMIVDPWNFEDRNEPVRLFCYARSQQVPNSKQTAESWHTNVPRSADNGLPHEWEALIYGMRAETDLYVPAVWAWAAKTYVRFTYRCKTYFETSLLSLLKTSDPRRAAPATKDSYAGNLSELSDGSQEAIEKGATSGWEIPVRLQENLSFEVTIESSIEETRKLREYLREIHTPSSSFKEGVARLETIANLASGYVGTEIKKALDILSPNRDGLFIRVHLDGLFKKPVM